MTREKKEPIKNPTERATPDGRIVYDPLSIIESKEAEKHFEELDRLAEAGLIPKPR